ncbi:hypothetical protein GCM10023144_44140 [Pigmentiphaga soli]|uniref:RNA polymerase sigma factor 70 region 4 type 2 domain-containing protein n=1 Tax=Pigmentiphaga soli TaxID=1007095 RepID=A0ABP8HPL3_9BURK
MTGAALTELRRLFSERYEMLKAQLVRRLGSAELAGDALHDAYVQLADRGELNEVRHPQAYLLHTAFNAAIDRLRGSQRYLSADEVSELYELADVAPGPGQTVEARVELTLAVDALAALPARQRDILYAARVDGLSLKELALRWGISTRLVSRELQAAHEFCVRHMAAAQAPGGAPDKERPPTGKTRRAAPRGADGREQESQS